MSEDLAKIVYLGIGSNLGSRKQNIEKAKFELKENNIKFISFSKYYETPSWPNPSYPKYLNIILKIVCYHNPLSLLNICKKIEIDLGRKKSKKNSPRICDIDIIDFHGKKLNIKNKLNLPHKRMHKRNFVLIPLFEIEKNWRHPSKKLDIRTLISLISMDDITSIKQI
tara:strand:- start:10 stop:513 length:504 start_codon:yes stop_codon:yes gene_type:complete